MRLRLVIEVLSPTTQHFDCADKLRAYQRPAGLQHIILLSSMEGWGDRFRRQAGLPVRNCASLSLESQLLFLRQ